MRWLAAGLLHVRLEAEGFAGGTVRGQLLFGEPVLHLPLYAAPRPGGSNECRATSSHLHIRHRRGTRLYRQHAPGLAPPTDVVPLAAVMELKLRSPNTRPSWLHTNEPDRYDHADLQYVGVTSDAALGPPVAAQDARIYFGVTTWANWSTPNEITVSILLDVNHDGRYEYRLANGTPTAPIFGVGPVGPLVSELYDSASGRLLAQQPLNGVPATAFDTNLFFGNAMILPVRLADLGLGTTGGNIDFVVQTESTDTVEGQGGVRRPFTYTALRSGPTGPVVFGTKRLGAHVFGPAGYGRRCRSKSCWLSVQPAGRGARDPQPQWQRRPSDGRQRRLSMAVRGLPTLYWPARHAMKKLD